MQSPIHIIPLSGQSFDEITQKSQNIAIKLSSQTNHDLDAWDEDATNYAFAYGQDRQTLIQSLEQIIPYPNIPDASVVFLFTGQGSQYSQMGQQFYDTIPETKAVINHCHQYLQQNHQINLLSLLFDPDSPWDIHQTQYTQVCLFVIEYALAKLWHMWGVQPDYLIGHSIGEIAAAAFADAIPLDQALSLVATRGQLMQALPSHSTMVAVFADVDTCQTLIDQLPLDIAGINHPKQTVIAGDQTSINQLIDRCQQEKIRATKLNVSHGFHSRSMDPMQEPFHTKANTLDYQKLSIPMISTVTNDVITQVDADYWTKQIRQGVNFSGAIHALPNKPMIFIEIGPQPILTQLTKRNLPSNDATYLHALSPKKDDWLLLMDSLQKLCNQCPIQWSKLEPFYYHDIRQK